MNFLVFAMSALVGAAFGWLLQKLAGGAALSLDVFVKADSVFENCWSVGNATSTLQPLRTSTARISRIKPTRRRPPWAQWQTRL